MRDIKSSSGLDDPADPDQTEWPEYESLSPFLAAADAYVESRRKLFRRLLIGITLIFLVSLALSVSAGVFMFIHLTNRLDRLEQAVTSPSPGGFEVKPERGGAFSSQWQEFKDYLDVYSGYPDTTNSEKEISNTDIQKRPDLLESPRE